MDINSLSLALGASLTAGLNLYLTLFTLGMMHRFDVLTLPPKMEILANPWILGIVGLLTIADFIADKFPGLATIWDYIQSSVRIPASAALAAGAFTDAPTHLLGLAGVTGGVVGATSFLGNRSAREAAKAMPGSGLLLSFGKEGISVSLLWFVANHPYVALVSSLILLAIFAVAIYYFFRFLKRLFRTAVATAKNPRSLADKLPWRRTRAS